VTEDEFNWPYWSVDIPGMSRGQAEELLDLAVKVGMSFGGTAVDPSDFLTLQLDRTTVESLYLALSPVEGHSTSTWDEQISAGVREILKEWLDGLPDTLPGSGETGPEAVTEDQFNGPYWSIDLPGISRGQAHELLALAAKAGISLRGTIVDPSEIFTIHLDRSTIEGLYRALNSADKDEASVSADGHDADAVREALKEWLDENGS
jgi:hypothetical protein